MRGIALLPIMLACALAAPTAALAQSPAPENTAGTGGAAYSEDTAPAAAPDPSRPIVEGTRARRLPDGRAAAPSLAPLRVKKAIWAANEIVGKPYQYGGGHGSFKSAGYDCSGTISYALRGARLLKAPLDSGSFMSWRRPGKGRWITVYTNPGHAYVVIAGLRLDTSAAGERVSSGKGPRWRTGKRDQAGFVVRHAKGF